MFMNFVFKSDNEAKAFYIFKIYFFIKKTFDNLMSVEYFV